MKRTARRVVFIMAACVSAAGLSSAMNSVRHQPVPAPIYQNETTATAEQPKEQPKPLKQAARQEQTKLVKVKPGDTLAKIAKREKSTVKNIFNANKKLNHPDDIQPGDKLVIPDKDDKLEDRYTSLMERLKAEEEEAKRQAALRRQKAQASQQPATKPAVQEPVAVVRDGSVWDDLAACESGGNWSINTGNGYYGGLQFSLDSWQAVGGNGYPHEASKSEQIRRGEILQSRQGWGAWPSCAAKLGLT